VSSGAWWRSPASGPGRRRDSVPAADRGCRGVGRISGCLQCSIAGSSVGPSSSRLVKPATKRRRRLVAIAGKWCQVERGTAHRLPIGRSVAWSGSRGAGNPRLPLAWPVLAALDHRQFGRAFVLSIGEAGHEATTAPGGDRRQVGQGEARQRTGCRSGLPWRGQALGVQAIRGCRWRGPCWKRSTIGSSVGPSSSRLVKPATKRRRRQCRAVPGGDRRQAVLGRRRDSIPAADRSCRGLVRLSGCWQCSITGSSAGPSFSRLVNPATRRRRRQRRAVPGGDRRQVGEG
jgi:hypothetical protein